jgi:polysaccharide chain length determinant protein (PEP-CTERM system associated)
LQATENKIKAFRLKYMAVNRDGQDYFARMSALEASIEQAKLDLEAAEQSRDSYKAQLAGETPVYVPDANPASGETSVTMDVDTRINALKRDLDTLLRKYTDQHPDVIATRKLIKQLEEQRTAELDARRKAAAAEGARPQNPLDQNPVFQQLRISLADSQATVASTRAKLAGLQSQFQQLKAQAQLVPQVEAEFTQLNRDYDVQKKTYQSLVARRESANMGKDVQDTGGAQFRIIDPPRVSPEPVAPNRLALLGLVVVLSLGAGVFASLIVSQLMPTFHDARALRDITKRPIIGMVSILQSDSLRRRKRRNAWYFAGGVGGLFATLTAVFAFALLVGHSVA